MKRMITGMMCGMLCLSLTAGGVLAQENTETTGSSEVLAGSISSEDMTSESSEVLPVIDNTKWQYNADDDVYYQIGISYCSDPADADYETLAIFVPGAYMIGTDNGDGTYTCEIDPEAEINGYTAETAPIVMPINTPGYSAQAALTEYTDVSDYMNAGFVYVHAGCRGREDGAPAGVTDLKAAIRYIRYSDENVPGDAESVFTFGMSGGGAQSSIVGATGDSDLYEAYLEEIGAVEGYSDAVLGSMCWCPITNLDTADEAYEWMMGSTRKGLSEEEQDISDALAEAFAEYINGAGLKDEEGNVLTLEESEEGVYQNGSYYDYMKSVIEESLNNFLAETTFPYDASFSDSGFGGHGNMTGGPEGGFNGERPSGGGPGRDFDGDMPSGERPEGKPDGDMQDIDFEEIDDIERTEAGGTDISISGTYETAQDYIDALNADGEWITYDAETNTATITSIEDFVNACKNASKSLGAFDQLDAGQGENTLFGYGDGDGAHFDGTLAAVLDELGSSYADAYEEDLNETDSVGNTVNVRVDMYTPLYYLLESEDGYGTSTVAKYWRIRTGIEQGDCALSTEMNLALALEGYDTVESVDFETIWGQGHTMAESSGSSTDNFIDWVENCTKRI